MEKINFVNNSLPAINDTNLNKLQDNVEDAIEELGSEQNAKVKTAETSSNVDTYACNYINNLAANSITYCCNYADELSEFSETEKRIGTYNGKPLYRKIIPLTQNVSPTTTEATIQLPLTNIARAWLNNKSTIIESNNVRVPFPNINGANSSYTMGGYIAIISGVPEVRVRKGNGLGILSEEFVVEYTKTTD